MDPDPSDISVGNLTEKTFSDIHTYAKKVAPKVGKKLGIPAEDLVQDFMTKIVEKEYHLEEVRFFKTWTYTGLFHVGLNQRRHYRLEWNSTEPLEWEDGHSKEGCACKQEDGAYRSTADPLKILLSREDYEALRNRVLDIVNNILEPLPPRQQFVVCSMLQGVPAEEIAKRMGRARKTVYKLGKALKPTFKGIVDKLKLEAHLRNDPDLVGALADLVASSLGERSSSVYTGV